MKFASLLALAYVAVVTRAATVPGLRARQNAYDRATFEASEIVDKIASNSGNTASKLSQYLDDGAAGIPPKAVDSLREALSNSPEQVSELTFKTPAIKANVNSATFDFHVSDRSFPNHKLRVKTTPEELGIDTVQQYTGYLDIEDEDKHFFYWFFESRNDPKNDPIILWLNGGPGCSSMTGLFFELGPSSINAQLKPVHNPYSWNNNASIIFLDQPVNVGFSYSSQSVSNTVTAGEDVYAFLELFFKQFPQYKDLDFHIAGESYGGHYIPVLASEILSHSDRSFNFKSVLIGNGLVDPLTQYSYYEPMACGEGGVPSVLSPQQCQSMNSTIPRCTAKIEDCYSSNSVFECVAANFECNRDAMSAFSRTGLNVYDMRTQCEGNSGLCYTELEWVQSYLNQAEVQEMLGVEVTQFQSCNNQVNSNFVQAGDNFRPYQRQVTEILEAGLPVLIYAGDKDFICNWLGNQAWVNNLPWSGHEQFEALELQDWNVNDKVAGQTKNYKNFTFLRVYEAGHQVPHDQPENSLSMFNRWISGEYAL